MIPAHDAPMIDALLDKAAAELVEELLASCAREGGEPWFNIVRRKLEKVANSTNFVRQIKPEDN